MFLRLRAATAALFVALTMLTVAPADVLGGAPTFTGYTPTGGHCCREGIATGPDGNLWFAGTFNHIGKITPAGVSKEFTLPEGAIPNGITAGPDGALWFTDSGTHSIGRIPTAGTPITEYPVPSAAVGDLDPIIKGPDGNLWFTETDGNKIAKITPLGGITEFAMPRAGLRPFGLTVGSDGAIWFAEASVGGKIGRIDPITATVATPGIVEYPLPTALSNPLFIATGPDGALWITNQPGDATHTTLPSEIDRMTIAGTATNAFPVPGGGDIWEIVKGPDGNMWFTDDGANKLWRITLSGAVTGYTSPTPSADPFGITNGPDGNLWITEIGVGKVATVAITPDAPVGGGGGTDPIPPMSAPPIVLTADTLTFAQDGVAVQWSNPAGTACQVILIVNGDLARPIAVGLPAVQGSQDVSPLNAPGTYDFRLYCLPATGAQAHGGARTAGTSVPPAPYTQLVGEATATKLTPNGTAGASVTSAPSTLSFAASTTQLVRSSTVRFGTADGSVGRVMLSVNGGPEQLFAAAQYGTVAVPWVFSGVYTFRFVAGGVTAGQAVVATTAQISSPNGTTAGGPSPDVATGKGTAVPLTFDTGNGQPAALCTQYGGLVSYSANGAGNASVDNAGTVAYELHVGTCAGPKATPGTVTITSS